MSMFFTIALPLLVAAAEPSAAAPAAPAASAVSADVEARITQLLAAHDEAWNAHDTKAIIALFTSDATVVAPNGTRFTGHAELRKMLATPAPSKTTTNISRTRIVALQQIASDVVLIDARQQVMDMPDVRMGTAIVLVARKSDDGQWRVAAVRLNQNS